jgi:hypothetical protein
MTVRAERREIAAGLGIGTALALGLMFLLLVAGCGQNDKPEAGVAVDAAVGSDGGSADASSKPPLYVVSFRVLGAAQDQWMMLPVSSLEKGTIGIDHSRAVELGTGGWIFGLGGTPYVYAAPFDEPTITRWEVSGTGTFRMDRKISFANVGLKTAYAAAYSGFLSNRKAYFVDGANRQIVIWDPTEMSILGTIAIPVSEQGALQPMIGDNLVVRSDRVFAEVSWADPKSGWIDYGQNAQLFAIDPATDKIVESSMVAGCGQLSASGVARSGAAYFSPWDYRAAVRSVFGAPRGVAPCAARIVPPAGSFDQAWQVKLDELVGGRPAGDLRLVSDDTAVIHVFHQELANPTAADWKDSRFKAHYLWWRWKIGAKTAELIPGQTPATEGALFFGIDGRQFLPSNASDFSTTTLIEFDAQANMKEGLTMPGIFHGVVRIH